MPSLSVAFEQQVEQEPDQSTEPSESQRESRKSGGSGASTSGSNGGEIITTHLDNRFVCVWKMGGGELLSYFAFLCSANCYLV